ncbi:unnamed protein product [Periconia digitata]|uniref:Uncharacterized protein n=1 Tax=Periconia digitata TaxID=1303443 RepID=A0A9W4XQ15_9PLEO|nr:unnamed protein product [Periconia digitata]
MLRYQNLAEYHNPQPISRAAVLAQLRDADDNPYAECPEDKRSAVVQHVQLSSLHASTSEDASLQHARANLEALYDKQRASTDWSLDCERTPRSCHSIQLEKRTLDTSILRRIADGRGPRDAQYKDLLGPLRLAEQGSNETHSAAHETYEDLLKVLLAWNRHVAPIQDLIEERQELMEALRARDQLIDEAAQRNTLRLLNQPFPRLQKALCAFRPEIAHFANQDVSSIMIIMVANIRVAIDIDDDLKCAIFKTLFKEATVRLLFDRSFRSQRGEFRMEQKSARDRGDWDEVHRLKEKEREVERQYKAQRASEIIDSIRFARGDLYNKYLMEMQDLAVVQTAQMEVAAETHSPQMIMSTIEEGSKGIYDDEDGDDRLQGIGEVCNRDAGDINRMLEVTRDCLHRTRKFAALDVVDAVERNRVRRERMDMPGTASMMMKVVEDTKVIRGMSMNVLKHMGDMETGLEEMMGAATTRYQAIEGGLRTIGEVGNEDDEEVS